MSIRSKSLALCCTLAALALPALPVRADQARDIDWSADVPAGTTLAISAINGSIVADGAPGSRASLRLHVTSGSNDVAAVRLKVKQSPGRIAICADTPQETFSDDCSSSHTTSFVDFGGGIRIEYAVHVPRGVNLQAKTVNGRIDAENLASDVDAKTVNGRITIATTGVARAKAVNGRIEVRIGESAWRGELDFKTVNGTIAVHLPRNASFSVHASAVVGWIDAGAFKLAAESHFIGQTLDGKVGSNPDGRALRLSCVNCKISLLADS